MVTYRRETYEQIIGDIKPLLERHWKEVALYQDAVPLDPDYGKYQQMDRTGSLVIIACRREGILIGYAVFFLNHHLHYQGSYVALNDVLFLDASERKGGLGLKLILASVRILVGTVGVTRILWHSKPDHDFSPLLKRLGYIQEEIIMGKLYRPEEIAEIQLAIEEASDRA